MCAMAMLHARLKRVVFAALDPKTGVAGSVLNLFDLPTLNHHTCVQGGLLAEPAAQLLRDFFAERREAARERRHAARAVDTLSLQPVPAAAQPAIDLLPDPLP